MRDVVSGLGIALDPASFPEGFLAKSATHVLRDFRAATEPLAFETALAVLNPRNGRLDGRPLFPQSLYSDVDA
jgi:hypothetical protein